MESVGHSGSLSAKETEDVEGISPISKKAKCNGDVGGPSFSVALVADRITAAEAAATAASDAHGRIPMTLLAEYLELRSIIKKHILEILSDKDEVSRTEGLLAEIESRIGRISRSLCGEEFLMVYTVSEAKAAHYLMSDHAWAGRAAIFDEEVGPDLMDVSEAVKQLNIPHCHPRPVKSKCPRDLDLGSSPISKKAKCHGDVGGPSFSVALVADRIAAAEAAATAATDAYDRIPMILLAEYLELRTITKKHILEIQSDKDEVSRTEGLLAEIESKIGHISRSLRGEEFLIVYTVSEAKAAHYLMSDHAWAGRALIFDEEVGPDLGDVSEAVKQLNIPHLQPVKSKCPRDLDLGSSSISKKAKCHVDVGGPSFSVAFVADRIAAMEAAATAATDAYHRTPMTLLAEYLELRTITKKHILEIQSDKDEVSRTECLLAEIEPKIRRISRSLRGKEFLMVYTVSEAKAAHYLMSDHAWAGRALIFDEEVGPDLADVSEAVKQLNIPHSHCYPVKSKSKSKV